MTNRGLGTCLTQFCLLGYWQWRLKPNRNGGHLEAHGDILRDCSSGASVKLAFFGNDLTQLFTNWTAGPISLSVVWLRYYLKSLQHTDGMKSDCTWPISKVEQHNLYFVTIALVHFRTIFFPNKCVVKTLVLGSSSWQQDPGGEIFPCYLQTSASLQDCFSAHT